MSDLPERARFAQIDAELDALLACAPDQRVQRLAAVQARDPEAARVLHRLLAAATGTDRLDAALGSAMAHAVGTESGRPGELLGDWQLVEPLGRGGMAEVWLGVGERAHRGQQAAIKRLPARLASRELLARFARERRILAAFDDPGIARLIDGGFDAAGLPWIALEYVDGTDLVSWCDQRALGVDERLRLFCEIATTVARAHRHLIVHRDIKPSNVMIDRDGRARLLDFGIAKLLDPEPASDEHPATVLGGRVLTPDYASPEQVRGLEVTVASDVYQLGLLLHELLTGERPFRRSGRTTAEHEHQIVAVDAELPSRVAHADTTEGSAVQRAASRSSTPVALVRNLRGDLDAIVYRALRKDPALRYATVDALCDDVSRHRAHLPVRARRPQLAYLTQRFLRRHAAGSLMVLALLAATLFYTLSVIRQAAALEREVAVNRESRAYLVTLFRKADPGFTGGREASAADVLRRGAEHAMDGLADQPELQADMLSLLSQVYLARSEAREALPLAQRAVQLQRTLPEIHAATRRSALHTLGQTYVYLGNLAAAEAPLREALAISARDVGLDAAESMAVRLSLARLLHHRGSFDAARAELQSMLAALAASPLVDAPIQRTTLVELADTERDGGRLLEAAALYRRALGDTPDPGSGPPMARADYGRCLLYLGRTDAARAFIERAAAVDQARFGAQHYIFAVHQRNLGLLAEADGRLQAADAALAGAIASYDRSLGRDHYYSAQLGIDHGFVLLQTDRSAEAQVVFEQAQAVLGGMVDGGHPAIAAAWLGRGLARWKSGAHAAAVADFRAARAHRARSFGALHPYTLAIDALLAAAQGRAPPALPGDDVVQWFELQRLRAAALAAGLATAAPAVRTVSR